jgi:hypothetical protein
MFLLRMSLVSARSAIRSLFANFHTPTLPSGVFLRELKSRSKAGWSLSPSRLASPSSSLSSG